MEPSQSDKIDTDKELETSKKKMNIHTLPFYHYSDGDFEVTQGYRFSRFNDSMKINKRRMSKEEKAIGTENI